LTEYFLNSVHITELNITNILGSKGEICLAFGELIRDFWEGSECYIEPKNFYAAVKKFVPHLLNR
jgi:hypothetical protein